MVARADLSGAMGKRKRWPTTAAESARMAKYQEQNIRTSLRNPNENWMASLLPGTGRKWRRQARWGYRIFDFWCAAIGVAVEVDGPDHRKAWDAIRDEQDHRISGIVVLRVRNKNEGDAALAIKAIGEACSWNQRRLALGLKEIGAQPRDDSGGGSKTPTTKTKPRPKRKPLPKLLSLLSSTILRALTGKPQTIESLSTTLGERRIVVTGSINAMRDRGYVEAITSHKPFVWAVTPVGKERIAA